MTGSRGLRLEVEDQIIHGRLEGREDIGRPVVVYVHGFGSSGFGEKGDFFSLRFADLGLPFCRFDLRGHGGSSGGLDGITVERNLRDLEVIFSDLRRRGFRRFLLVGSSYGALTCLAYCVRNPGAVIAGVFVAPAVGIADSIRRREGAQAIAAWRQAGTAPLGDGEGSLNWTFYEDAERWSGQRIAPALETPCLLFHGLCDDEVEWGGVLDLALRSRDVELHGFVDGDHRLIDYLPRIWEEAERFVWRVVASGR